MWPLQKPHVQDLEFADDEMLLGNNPAELQGSCRTLFEAVKQQGYHINEKTQVRVFGAPTPDLALEVGEHIVRAKDDPMEYLGILFKKNL